MSLFASAVDYKNAIRTAANRKRRSGFFILAEVVCARLFFNIGPLYYSLFSLDQKSVSVWSEYILDKEANTIVRRINLPFARQLVTDKLRFYQRMAACNFPTIPVLAIITKSTESIDENGFTRITTLEDFVRFAAKSPDEIFLKTLDGAHGEDAFAATRQGGQWIFDGRAGEAADLFSYCIRILGDRRGWLIQTRLHSHSSLIASLSPHALGTIRIVTALSRGTVTIVAAALKIPVGNSVTDNFSKGASGNIVAPIDLQTGKLGVGQMSKSRCWPEIFEIDRHPDTGYRIPGFVLPYWNETVALVSDIQRELKEAPTLGWDIALTDTGPLIVEANAGYSVEIHEIAEQRGLRSMLLDISSAVSNPRDFVSS